MHRTLADHAVDLVVMHYLGGYDSSQIIDVLRLHKVPYLYINHFSNEQLNSFSIQAQAREAAGIAGVSDVNVPARERSRFTFIGDGVDLSKYRPKKDLLKDEADPMILMPARITPTKGQKDLILACRELQRQGVRFRIEMAGRVDDEGYHQELRKIIADSGLEPFVRFVGQLGPEELRRSYARAAVVALPTYHPEGLPRVLLEAQAMQVPPVAYRTGGISEAIVPAAAGCLLETGDLEGLTKRLHELLITPELRWRLGAAGREHVNRTFSLDVLASRHEAFYRSALSGESRPIRAMSAKL
jgi:glycosyltransferase involved in cell wall biosynthesis